MTYTQLKNPKIILQISITFFTKHSYFTKHSLANNCNFPNKKQGYRAIHVVNLVNLKQ